MKQAAILLMVCLWLIASGSLDLSVLAASLPGRSSLPLPTTITEVAVPISRGMPVPQHISARAYAVFERRTGSLLVSQLDREQLAPASTIKMLTAMTALKIFSLNQIITITNPPLEEKSTLQPGDELTLEDALKVVLISSSNQAAESIATAAPGGRSEFINQMNRMALSIGLNDTAASNPTGFDEPLQRSSIRDLTHLADILLANPLLSEIVAEKLTTIRPRNRDAELILSTTNSLLLSDPEAMGVKTGTTPWAGEVLVSRFVSPQYDLIVVVHGSQDRFADTRALIAWVRNTYQFQPLSLDAMIY